MLPPFHGSSSTGPKPVIKQDMIRLLPIALFSKTFHSSYVLSAFCRITRNREEDSEESEERIIHKYSNGILRSIFFRCNFHRTCIFARINVGCIQVLIRGRKSIFLPHISQNVLYRTPAWRIFF